MMEDEVTEFEIVAFGQLSGRLPGRATIYAEAPRLLDATIHRLLGGIERLADHRVRRQAV